jgi:hypothetical protein
MMQGREMIRFVKLAAVALIATAGFASNAEAGGCKLFGFFSCGGGNSCFAPRCGYPMQQPQYGGNSCFTPHCGYPQPQYGCQKSFPTCGTCPSISLSVGCANGTCAAPICVNGKCSIPTPTSVPTAQPVTSPPEIIVINGVTYVRQK